MRTYYSILKENLVAIAEWVHLFPSRTQKLSTLTLMIVGLARKSKKLLSSFLLDFGGLAQLGEHLPYKQRVGGSSPSTPTISADLAQLVEQLTFNQWVRSSNLPGDTIACLSGGIGRRAGLKILW